MTYRILRGDVLSFARHYRGPLFHACLCDPPYHLTSIVKRFSSPSELDYEVARSNPHRRTSSGFMGSRWDGGDLAFQPATWAAFSNLLYPGAFLMAFASSRGWHRMACAIEDAGFSIMPSIFGWCNGQPFPKATRIDSRIEDKELAKDWVGHRYGGQVLKNALEPIIVAQKPYDGRPIDNITMTGAGALNIDAGRIGTVKNVPVSKSKTKTDGIYGKFAEGGIEDGDGFNPNVGRWPANFILQHSPQCKRVGEKRVHGSLLDHDCESGGNMFSEESGTGGFKRSHKKGHTDSDGMETVAEWECVPECAVRKLGEQSGTSSSNGHRDGGDRPYTQEGYRRKNSTMYQNKTEWDGVDDSGTASRFFYNSSWEYEQQEPDWNIEVDERLLEADPVRYEAKASTAERNVGLDCYLTVKYTSGKEISRIWEGEKTGLAELLRRVIYEFGITVEKNLNIAVSGGIITVLCHRDILSTTKTAISKITESKILNLLMRLPTSEYTVDVNLLMDNGGSRVLNAERQSLLQKNIGISQKRDGFVMGDVAHAIYELLFKISNENGWQPAHSNHPTHKPISLTRHLASLLLPPDRYSPRRLFVPFSGVSSECIGALLAGWDEIIGVEGEADYAKIGRTRLAWWEQRMKETGLTEPKAILKTKSKSTTRKNGKKKDDNPSLF